MQRNFPQGIIFCHWYAKQEGNGWQKGVGEAILIYKMQSVIHSKIFAFKLLNLSIQDWSWNRLEFTFLSWLPTVSVFVLCVCAHSFGVSQQTHFFPHRKLASLRQPAVTGHHLASTAFPAGKSPESSRRGNTRPSLALLLCSWYFSHKTLSSWQAWHTYSAASKYCCCINYISWKK